MKIRFFFLLLALSINVASYANAATILPTPTETTEVESVMIVLKADYQNLMDEDAGLKDMLTPIIKSLGDKPTCEVTLKVKLGTSGTGIEASFTVKGDCDEIMEIASDKLSELKKLIR